MLGYCPVKYCEKTPNNNNENVYSHKAAQKNKEKRTAQKQQYTA